MADWKENKLVGIAAGVVAVITVVLVILYSMHRFAGDRIKSEYPPKEGVPVAGGER